MDANKIDQHLNAVLRAAGSALRHYSLPKSLEDMRAAMKAAIDDATSELQARVAELESEKSTPEPIKCETCQGSGKIDERLGGYNFSNPSATCPDCDGLGEIEPIHDSRVAAPVRLTDDQVERALRTNGAYESDAAYAMAKDGLLTDARAIESAALRANGFKVEE